MKRKNILITGSSTGFGRLTAQELAKQGHQVFATMRHVRGRNAEHADALKKWARDEGVALFVVELDVTSDESVRDAANSILSVTGGKIDVIINNAGIYGGGLQEAFTIEDYKHFFDVNVYGPARVNNTFLPILRKQGHGLIVQVTSVLGRIIIPFGGLYDATKFAAEALAENLAYELKPLGIDVAIVQPGPFATELLEKQYRPSNEAITADYGKPVEYMQAFASQFTQMMTNPDMPNKSIQVAQAIVDLVNAPKGEVPLRTVVDKMMGGTAEILNETAKNVQSGLLQSLGLDDLKRN